MKYMMFDSLEEAEAFSVAMLEPPPPPGSVTTRMWEPLVHADGTAVLCVPADTEGLLTENQRDDLLEELPEGYSPPIPPADDEEEAPV